MALSDINILISEQLDFVLEVPTNTLSAPVDIVFHCDQGLVLEIPPASTESFGGSAS